MSEKIFVGREEEIASLRSIEAHNDASIIVLYGRRRIGKTALLEHVFQKRSLIKIEGIEGLEEQEQIQRAQKQFSKYFDEPLLQKVILKNWFDFFELIAPFIKKGVWTLYFEEIQWLASYKANFIAELKYAWDNYFQNNSQLIIILCGSSPSFITNHVLDSKALYNRSQYEIELKPFSLKEACLFLPKRSKKEVLNAYLSVGGIPEYLKWINKKSSVFLSLCDNSFRDGGFFVDEYERIFTSSLSDNSYYQKIIELLSKHRFLTREEIQLALKINSGGTLTNILRDLDSCGFIHRYSPYNLNEKSLLTRYSINDEYLHFYYKFIKPIKKRIKSGDFNSQPSSAIKHDNYAKWLGFAFERFVRKNHSLFARILGFEAINYNYGSFFNRSSVAEDPGYQIDLLYERTDKVYTICEIKYTEMPVTKKVIQEFERKLSLFPNKKSYSIHKVLIAPNGAEKSLVNEGYFDKIITLDDLL